MTHIDFSRSCTSLNKERKVVKVNIELQEDFTKSLNLKWSFISISTITTILLISGHTQNPLFRTMPCVHAGTDRPGYAQDLGTKLIYLGSVPLLGLRGSQEVNASTVSVLLWQKVKCTVGCHKLLVFFQFFQCVLLVSQCLTQVSLRTTNQDI